MHLRLLLLAVLAAFVAGTGTPASGDGLVSVPVDADSVDGFDASATPMPGWLLPLDASGRFPTAVIPMGPGSGLDADTLDGLGLDEILGRPAGGLDCAGCVDPGELSFTAATAAELAAESAARSAGDGALSVALGDETAARRAGDDGLLAGLSDETAARQAGDDALRAAVDAEASARAAADQAMTGRLDAIASPGTINATGNPVHWSKLAGVPSGFADGIDNVTGTALSLFSSSLSAYGTSAPFTTNGGTLLIMASGSGFSTIPASLIGMDVKVDGVTVGSARTFTNEASSHKAFVSNFIVVPGLAAGSHTLTVTTRPGTSADFNDFVSVSVLELG